MIRWDDVSYELNGFDCTVVFTTAKEPKRVRYYTGVIVCPEHGAVAHLKDIHSKSVMKPPSYARAFVTLPKLFKTNTGWGK